MKILEWVNRLLRRRAVPQATVKVAPVIVKRCPILDKYRNRYSPESSLDGEELYCNGMIAEDGMLRIFRDRLVPGSPVVEVRIGEESYDLRGCPVFRTVHGVTRHPRWAFVQKKVLDWLILHDCPEVKSPKLGYWVYDPAA